MWDKGRGVDRGFSYGRDHGRKQRALDFGPEMRGQRLAFPLYLYPYIYEEEVNMNAPFRIEKRDSFRVVGYVIDTTNQKKAGAKAIPDQWAQFHEAGSQNALMPLMNQDPYGLFGISVYNIDEKDSRRFRHLIAVSSDGEAGPGMDVYTVPAATWAVFPCTMETIGKTEAMAITKWLPKSGYKPLNSGYLTGRMKSTAPDIEYYGEGDSVEVWVAVREK